MGKWDEFYSADMEDVAETGIVTDADETVAAEDTATDQTEVAPLDTEGVWRFCNRLSGKHPDTGMTKSVVTYQTYDAATRPEDAIDPASERIFNLSNANVELSYDPLNPELMLLTLTFPSYDDPELRLFWARLNHFRQKETGSDEVKEHYVPVFLIHLFERDAVQLREENNLETYVEANLVNPILCYITRQIPTDAAVEQTNAKGEVIGGNVVKCLFSTSLIQFDEKEDTGFSDIKAEVLREFEEEAFRNAQDDAQ